MKKQNPTSLTLPKEQSCSNRIAFAIGVGIFIMRTISEAFDRIENEIWKEIPNYEGMYKISSMGRVKSLKRIVVNGKNSFYIKNEQLLIQYKNRDGYLSVGLTKNNITKTITVHRIISGVFLNHNPDGTRGLVCNHINGVRSDNRLENLELCSQRYNSTDGYLRVKTTSKYTGVYWHKDSIRWRSEITINNTGVFLCLSKDEEFASHVYNIALQNISKYNGNRKEFRNYIKSLI